MFCSHSRNLRKKNSACCTIFPAEFPKLPSKFPHNHSEEKCFFEDKVHFQTFSDPEQIFSAFRRKFFGRDVQTCIVGVHLIILKKLLLEFFFHFWSLSKKSGAFLSEKFGTLVKTAFYVKKKKVLWEKCFCHREKKDFLEHLLALNKKFWLHGKKFSAMLWNCILSVRSIIFKRKI